MKCLRCHQDNPSQAKFCLECGTSLHSGTMSPADGRDEIERLRQSLNDALEQRTATAEILRVIASSPTDAQPVFDTIARSASRLCQGMHAVVTRFDGELIHLVAQHNPRPGVSAVTVSLFPQPPSRDFANPRAILERTVVHIPDVEQDPYYPRSAARDLQARSILVVPMLRDSVPIGTIGVSRSEVGPFSPDQIELVKVFADQAVIVIENVRLFNQTKEALEQQTATAEILRVISSSPTDLQPVMDVVAASAARFCGAADAAIYRLEGESLRLVATNGSVPVPLPVGGTAAATPRGFVGRAVHSRQTIHVEDVALAELEYPDTFERQRGAGFPARTLLATPLLREGAP